MSEQDPEFLREEWSLYGLGVLIILTRFAVRIKTVGLRRFQGDDFMAVLVLAFFTMDAVTVHIIYHTGTNVEASVVQRTRVLTPAEIATYRYGSKEQLAAWYSYTALIWSMKGQMLFFFHRLTMGLWQHRFVKWLGLGCGVSYLVVVLTITFGCFPTYKNWQVTPDPGKTCTLKMQNFLTTVILNVLTDAAILAIPLPLLWKLKMELRRKIIIFLLLSSGLFVITAAIIRVVLTLGSNPSALNINRWGVRETIVGIITINLPILQPLFKKSFWSLQSFKSTSLSFGTLHNTKSIHNSNINKASKNHKDNNIDEENYYIELQSPKKLPKIAVRGLRKNTAVRFEDGGGGDDNGEREGKNLAGARREESYDRVIIGPGGMERNNEELMDKEMGMRNGGDLGCPGGVLVQTSYGFLSEEMDVEDLARLERRADERGEWRYGVGFGGRGSKASVRAMPAVKL